MEVVEDGRGSCWWQLFHDANDTKLALWTCMRGWRSAALRKKQRFVQLTSREQLEREFAEQDELPLHALVICMRAVDAGVEQLRFEWLQRIIRDAPAAPIAMDRRRHVALYYALEQQWGNCDQLSWLVAQSHAVLLDKDVQGRCLMTQAVLHNAPHEILMLMAVEYARSAIESAQSLVQARHFESARRLCVRMVESYFAGVPNFPHAFCLRLLRDNDALRIVDGMQTVWREFVDKWGYYGAPMITDDLPSVRHVPLNLLFQISIKAKGEPFSCQWFCDDQPIVGANEASLFVSQSVQRHNQGSFYCQVTNWKGHVVSSVMQLVVVDDTNGPDPSSRYLLSDDDKQGLREYDRVHRISASRGGLVHAVSPLSHSRLEGCSLLVPPKCLTSFSAGGADVSDSVGLDVVVRLVTWITEEASGELGLSHGEKLVSAVVEVLPSAAPSLQQPAILSIPHCWSADDDELHELVVIELVPSQEPIGNSDTNRQKQPRHYKDVDRSRLLKSTDRGVVSFEISRFGQFAVVARSVSAVNKENEQPLEDLILCVAHPRFFSTARERLTEQSIRCSVWLTPSRSDCMAALDHELRTRPLQSPGSDDNGCSAWTTSSMAIRLRQNQQLHIRMGSAATISYVWRGSTSAPTEFILILPEAAAVGVVCLRSEVLFSPQQLSLDPHSVDNHHSHSTSFVVFRTLELSVAVLKPPLYQSVKRASSRSSSARHSLPEGLVLLQQTWNILIPVLHDTPVKPPPLSLHQRRAKQLAVAYYAATSSHGEPLAKVTTAPCQSLALFEELHDTEREFSPYFYQLEMARFTETFWHRYDQTWWFDKTKSEILLGMFKLAHAGTEPYTVLASDAFAGVLRVAQCSVDAMSSYSEPFLLEPSRAVEHDAQLGATKLALDDEDDSTVPVGLRRILNLPPSLDLSAQSQASLDRLRELLDTVFTSQDVHVDEFFGVQRDFGAIRGLLQRRHTRIRAANYEVALLVLGIDRLAARIDQRVYLRATFFAHVWKRMSLLRRLIPEVDCFPVEHFAVTRALHMLVQGLFKIVWACSSPGWLARLLLNDWFESELTALDADVLRLLTNEAQQLQGSHEILETFQSHTKCCPLLSLERQSVRQLREYLLLNIGEPSNIETARARQEIAQLIKTYVPPTLADCKTIEDWTKLIENELQSDETVRALQHLHQTDTISNHILSVSPGDHERFTSKFPDRIRFRFSVHVVHVDTRYALKVSNATLRCAVQGQIVFSREQKSLEFVPAIPFDKHTQYQVKLRAQYVQTALGGALLPSGSFALEFSTAS